MRLIQFYDVYCQTYSLEVPANQQLQPADLVYHPELVSVLRAINCDLLLRSRSRRTQRPKSHRHLLAGLSNIAAGLSGAGYTGSYIFSQTIFRCGRLTGCAHLLYHFYTISVLSSL